MKKLTLMAIAMGMLAFTACTEKKPAAAPAAQVEEMVTDSAFQQAVAGEYKSADGKRIITVNADFTVKTTGLDKDYFKWDMDVKPQGPAANINLIRKGLDAEVKDMVSVDTEEGTLIVKNETYRKAVEAKK